MLPPPVHQAGPPAPEHKQRAGLAVLFVALAVLLGLVALVWWINENERDDDPFRSGAGPALVLVAPT